jgi:hypothetical protein
VRSGTYRGRAASIAVLTAAALALAACGSADAQPAPSAAEPGVGPRVGAPASACEMPVTFGLAQSWKPKPVTVETDDPLAELARKGPLTMVCEIDAKPAGKIGFLRVWTGGRNELRPSLEAFIGTDAREPVFTEFRLDDRAALEVVYRQKSELDEAMDQERAFAVETADGVAVVSLDSFDSDEHGEMLPAYELAKSSLTLTR